MVDTIDWPMSANRKLEYWPESNTREEEDQDLLLVRSIIALKTNINLIIDLYFSAGPLCLSKHKDGQDRRLDDDFESFKKFNRSLIWSCESGDPGTLEFTPNTSWPDIVYYNSFTQANMGWKIHIIDSFNQRASASAKLVSDSWIVLVPLVILIKRCLWLYSHT